MRKQGTESRPIDGQRFGKLVVERRAANCGDNIRYCCRCDCGNIAPIYKSNLTQGLTKSCGCIRKEKIIKGQKKRKAFAKVFFAFAKRGGKK